MPEAVFRFGHFVCSIFRRNGRAQVVERSLEARLVPQGRVPLVLLDSTERQAVCFNNIVPCRDMRLHRGKKRVITVIERIGKARVDILLEQVKRLRLRFDGYIYSPKLVYSVQLGFTSYDTEPLPNGNMNIVRDAIVYYVPSPKWNIGFGQTKIKANRARINSSSALQFVDRSIVNSEFNLDRDFGFFGEYNMRGGEGFNLSAKGSVTLGEGRNWGSSSNGGLAYTGRLELYPLGRFKSKGDVMEGDFEGEEQVKILVAGAYSYNHKASRLKGQRGAIMPDDATRNIGSYFADFILKYRGFAFYTDFMGRSCDRPLFDPQSNAFVYSGQGLNIQTSYLFDKKWEVALRNSTLFPEHEVQPFAGYKRWNQTTVGITRYIIGHSLKVQADMSYNHRSESFDPDYNRWEIRFQLELGL